MVTHKEKQREGQGRLHSFTLGFIRVLLVVLIFTASSQGRSLVFLFALSGLIITFIPTVARTWFGLKIPAYFELLVLLFIYGLLVFGSVKFAQLGLWWWDIILHFGSAVILGFVGFTLLTMLNTEELIDASSLMIAFLSFCFAVSLGTLWEVMEFSLDLLFGFGLQYSLTDTMSDLIELVIGSGLVSFAGYRYLRSGKQGLFSFFISNFMRRNWGIFRSKRYLEYSSNKIAELISKGEGDTLEFKSTLRKNLYTGKLDRDIEHAALKTIAAYLNTKGGTLLIGIGDSGKAIGIDNDEFANHDKLKLYLNQILRKQLGSSVLRSVQYEVYPFKDKHILRVECTRSNRRVFLKRDGKEEFFVRYGPSTVQLTGGDLIDYVTEHFN